MQRRVYVSGFLDWPDRPVHGFDCWRCEVNPSGRVLLGDWYAGAAKPSTHRGELPRLLARDDAIDWHFDTLPVRWGIGGAILSQRFDLVINVGLGVYDDAHTINLEKGAYNGRAPSTDAAADVPGVTPGLSVVIDAAAPPFLAEPAVQSAKLDGLGGAIADTAYTARPIEARATNAFICNETHYSMLTRLERDHSANPEGVYFIHIPKPADDGYAELAAALAHIIRRLVVDQEPR